VGRHDSWFRVGDGALATEYIHNARDAALSYLSKQYGEEAPEAGLTWTQRHVAPEVLVGW